MCYEDLRQLYAATAKERDELKKELALTVTIVGKQRQCTRPRKKQSKHGTEGLVTSMDKAFCLHCHDFMEYNVDLEPAYDGRLELAARCKACHYEVYVPFVHDQNIMERLKEGDGNV